MALLEIDWADPDQDFLTGLTDNLPPFRLPTATWHGGGDTFPSATLDKLGDRLRRFALHGEYDYALDPDRPQQEARLRELGAGEPDDAVDGDTRWLWRLLFAAVRADRFSDGLVANNLLGLTRLANELRRREMADRAADSTLSRVVDPWSDLPDHPPYVFWADRTVLEADHARIGGLQTHLHPGSYLGNPVTARVLLLLLNPGFAEQDADDEQAPASISARERGDFHRATVFEVLRPEFQGQSGAAWWARTLGPLIRALDAASGMRGREMVMRGVAAVEWFPYHSKTFTGLRGILPSQQLCFRLVHNAVRRGAVIVVLRNWRHWAESVPALQTTPVIHPRNKQRLSVSPGNMEPEEFERIISALTAPAQ